MAEQFRFRKGHIFQKGLDMFYPVFLFVMMIVLAFVVADSGGYLRLKSWAPLAMIGIGVWGAYETWQFIKTFKYRVTLDEGSIEINGQSVHWSDIKDVTTQDGAIGDQVAMTLYLNDGSTLQIPGGLDGLPYVRQTIQSKLRK